MGPLPLGLWCTDRPCWTPSSPDQPSPSTSSKSSSWRTRRWDWLKFGFNGADQCDSFALQGSENQRPLPCGGGAEDQSGTQHANAQEVGSAPRDGVNQQTTPEEERYRRRFIATPALTKQCPQRFTTAALNLNPSASVHINQHQRDHRRRRRPRRWFGEEKGDVSAKKEETGVFRRGCRGRRSCKWWTKHVKELNFWGGFVGIKTRTLLKLQGSFWLD